MSGRRGLIAAGALALVGLLPLTLTPALSISLPSFATGFAAGRVEVLRPAPSILIGTHIHALIAADLDGDGRPDLAVAREAVDQIEVLYGRGAAPGDVTFDRSPPMPVGRNPFALAAADFNGDGRLDLAVATWGDDHVVLLLGQGRNGRTLRPTGPIPAGRHPSALAVADFNGDGVQDLAVADEGGDQVTILLGTGVGFLRPGPTGPILAGRSPAAIVAADFDGDGRPDLAVANWEGHDVTILLGMGDGRFRPSGPGPGPGSLAVGREPVALAVADFNGDGRPDLAVANRADGTVSVLLNRGGGLFQPVSETSVGLQPSALVAADFNGDGRPDLAVANRGDDTVSLLLGRGDGTFVQADRLGTGHRPVALAATDLNGDGRPDLIVSNEHGGDLSIFLAPPAPARPGPRRRP